MSRTTLVLVLAALLSLGCEGTLGGAPAGPSGGPSPGPGGPRPSAPRCDGTRKTAPRPLARLTRLQYERAVQDLLGVPPAAIDALPDDDEIGGFEAARAISALHVEQHLAAARAVAQEVVLSRVVGCEPGETAASQRACAAETLRALGRRAWRRPLRDAELADLLATYDVAREGGAFEDGLRFAIEAMLAAPAFLYHLELDAEGAPGDVVPLEPYALATRLAFFLWNTLPDDTLLDAAARGELETAEGVDAHARRMLADPRAEATVQDFFRQWLHLDAVPRLAKDEAIYPGFDAQVARDLRTALEASIGEGLWRGDRSFRALLLGETAYLNARLAALYLPGGAPDDATDDTFAPIALDPRQRRGLLTHPALLALLARRDQSDPIHRGLFVRERLLCQPLPAPPNDVDLVVREPEPGASTRDRFAEHTASEACAGCHRLIDPIGFTFEHYDGIGRWRTEDDGVAVDARGELVGAGDASGEVDGALELVERLAASDDVHRCFTRQWFRYALRREDDRRDACSIDDAHARFVATGLDVAELIVGVARSDSFRHVVIAETAEEVSP